MKKIQKNFLFLIIVCLTVVASQAEAASYAELRISPNPCVIQENGLCTVDVNWTVPDDINQVQIWVSMDGINEKLLDCSNVEKTKQVPWIKKGHIYEFRVYESTSCEISSNTGQYLAAASVTGIYNKPLKPRPALGVSKADLMSSFLGRSSRGDGSEAYIEIGKLMGEKAIIDARVAGAKFMRFFGMGWHPAYYNPSDKHNDLILWQNDPNEYWKKVDVLMDTLDKYDMRAIPMIPTNITQTPSLTNETVRDFIVDRNSASYKLLQKYISEFINRYKDRDTIYFYDLMGEFNRRADIDLKKHCEKNKGTQNALCEPLSEYFTTEELIGFTTHLASFVRTLDSTRMVTSSFTIPRKSAQSLRENPQWTMSPDMWKEDSLAEFEKNLEDIHQGLDIITVHFYNTLQGDSRINERFGISGDTNADVLDIIKAVADRVGKPLWLSEFGDMNPSTKTNKKSPFLQNILSKVTQLDISYASPWGWEIYINNPYTTYDHPIHTDLNIEPGYTDEVIAKMKSTSIAMGNSLPAIDSIPEFQIPRIVLTWPLTDSNVSNPQKIYAVASNYDSMSVEKVEFLVNDDVWQTISAPPYTVDISDLQTGSHIVSASAYDENGNKTTVSLSIVDGKVLSRSNPVYSSKLVVSKKNCEFDNQIISHGSSITTYKEVEVSYSNQCVLQQRTCDDGVLNGTYLYTSCSINNNSNSSEGDDLNLEPRQALSDLQIMAIINLLSAFGVEESVIENVRNILNNTSVIKTKSTSLKLFRNLYLGMRGSDIERLQVFLKKTGDFTYSTVTTYYGNATVQAVQKYQCRKMQICSGSFETNGYGIVGPVTRESMSH